MSTSTTTSSPIELCLVDHSDEPADLDDVAFDDTAFGERSCNRSFQCDVDLVRLDLGDGLSTFDLLPFGDKPARQRRLLHGHAPLRQSYVHSSPASSCPGCSSKLVKVSRKRAPSRPSTTRWSQVRQTANAENASTSPSVNLTRSWTAPTAR